MQVVQCSNANHSAPSHEHIYSSIKCKSPRDRTQVIQYTHVICAHRSNASHLELKWRSMLISIRVRLRVIQNARVSMCSSVACKFFGARFQAIQHAHVSICIHRSNAGHSRNGWVQGDPGRPRAGLDAPIFQQTFQ